MNDKDKASLPFEQRVWDVLSKTDVTEHSDSLPQTGKRPAVSYLPWHKAWLLVKRNFPATNYSHGPDIHHPDGTVEIEVDLVIAEQTGGEAVYSNSRLAVMDNRFGPITNPTARQINDGRQRCLVKALAFAGLGLNLWGDDIIPVGVLDDPISDDQYAVLEELVAQTETDRHTFLNWCGVDNLGDLPFEKFRSARGLLEAKLRRMDEKKVKKAVKK